MVLFNLILSMNRSLLLLLVIGFVGCHSDSIQKDSVSAISGTDRMASILDSLYENGNPEHHYHWNNRLAALWESRINKGTPQQQINAWYEYCKQSLYAGNSQVTINQLEGYFKQKKLPYEEIIDQSNVQMFELLGLAYLRLGEQDNCLNNHSIESCILPLQGGGIHTLTNGSEKAIEVFTLIQNTFPSDRTKWLLNVAHMTLGTHPSGLSSSNLIAFTSTELKQSNFLAFEDIGMSLGVAVHGLSGGCITEDFNNDGWVDIFATSYGMQDQVKLFLNDTKGGFNDYTNSSGLGGIVSGLNCIQGDYNNDGLEDILILRGGWLDQGGNQPNSLLKNLGNGQFEDVTFSSGLYSLHPTQTATWLDYDLDGDLDLFVGNEGKRKQTHYCELFKNNGDETFTEVANQVGLGSINAFVKGVTSSDIDNDGHPDLFISVLGGKNLLFQNQNGQFKNIASTAGVEAPFFSFPTWFFDVNQDGFQDLFVCSYDVRKLEYVAEDYVKELSGLSSKSDRVKLYINNGDLTFTDQSTAYGIDKPLYGMGANFGDLDNDGYLDILIGTGAPDYSTIVPNRVFRNVNGKRFEEVTGAGRFGNIQKGHGIGLADFNRNGYQEVYMVLGGAFEGDTYHNAFYANPYSNNNWIVIDFEGTSANRSAIGTRLVLELASGKKLYRTVSSGGSFGASSLQQEIGLGKDSLISSIHINWPSGKQQRFRNIEANQYIQITEGENFVSLGYEPVSFQTHHEHVH